MTKRSVLFLSVLLLGSLLRLWQLGRVPEGFYSDEALYGYEAYSLLATGKDQFGNFLPTAIAGFGDWRPALSIYATIPPVAVFGLTEMATRLPSAIFSIATVIITYALVKNLVSRKLALLTMLLAAVSPWSIFFGRMAHEANLMTLLTVCGFYFLLRPTLTVRNLFVAVVFFAASLYTYHSARVFVPLTLVVTSAIFIRRRRQNILIAYLVGAVLLVSAIPIFAGLAHAGGARIRGVSIWDDPGLEPRVNEARGRLLTEGWSPAIARLFTNKLTLLAGGMLVNLTEEFSPRFLLFEGDPNTLYSTPKTGILLWTEPLLILAGISWWWRKNRRVGNWMAAVVLIGLMPDVLTRFNPSSARILHLLPLVTFLSASGLRWVTRSRAAKVIVTLLISVNLLWFWYHYLWVRPKERADVWQTGTKEMILKAHQLASRFEKIWISPSGWGWIHLVFHTRYDPRILQQEIKVSPPNELGFWWVTDVGKFHLEKLPENVNIYRVTLFIGKPDEFSAGVTPQEVIFDLLGNERYWLVRSGYQ